MTKPLPRITPAQIARAIKTAQESGPSIVRVYHDHVEIAPANLDEQKNSDHGEGTPEPWT